MAATTHVSSPTSELGRVTLRADGLTCTVAGAVALLGCRPISRLLGVDGALPVAIIGAGGLLYGLWLTRQTRTAPPRQLVRAIAVANVIWVIASLAALELGTPAFSTSGRVLVACVTAIVALFAAIQFLAYRLMA
jgi:hypothetical protein